MKTTYILRYVQDGDLLFWSQRGEFHRGDLQEVMNEASCLSLLSNAVIAWNVVEMDRIVANLRQAGRPASDADLRQVWPGLEARLPQRHVPLRA